MSCCGPVNLSVATPNGAAEAIGRIRRAAKALQRSARSGGPAPSIRHRPESRRTAASRPVSTAHRRPPSPVAQGRPGSCATARRDPAGVIGAPLFLAAVHAGASGGREIGLAAKISTCGDKYKVKERLSSAVNHGSYAKHLAALVNVQRAGGLHDRRRSRACRRAAFHSLPVRTPDEPPRHPKK